MLACLRPCRSSASCFQFADWETSLAGAQITVADKKGRTALHLAVGCSSRMVEKLLLLSVTIDAADMEGRTALHYAAQKGGKRLCTCMVVSNCMMGGHLLTSAGSAVCKLVYQMCMQLAVCGMSMPRSLCLSWKAARSGLLV